MKNSFSLLFIGSLALVAGATSSAQIVAYGFEGNANNSGSAGASSNLTLGGAITPAVIGPVGSGVGGVGQALDFSANTVGSTPVAYASTGSVSSLAGLAAITVSGWFNLSGVPDSSSILLRNNAAWNVAFSTIDPVAQTATLRFGTGGVTYTSTADFSIAQGVWQFFSVSWTSTEGASFYRATAGDAAISAAGGLSTPASMVTGAQSLTLGRSNSSAGAFDGWMDDLRIYGAALDAAQLQAVFLESAPEPAAVPEPSTTALIAGAAALAAMYYRRRLRR